MTGVKCKNSDSDRPSKKFRASNDFLTELNDMPDDVLLMIFDQLGLRSKFEKFDVERDDSFYQRDASESPANSGASESASGPDNSEDLVVNNEAVLSETILELPQPEYDDVQLNKLSLVCKRWKALIDGHHLYSKLNFFDQPKSEMEFQHLMETTKKFNSAVIVIDGESMQEDIERLEKFLGVQTKLIDVRLELNMSSIDALDIKRILKMFRNFESLLMLTGNACIANSIASEDYLTKFPKLQILVVSARSELLSNLSNFIDCPSLEILKLFGDMHDDNMGEHLSFANKSCSQHLKSVDFFSLYHSPRIRWTSKKLHLIMVNTRNPEVDKFLTPERLSKLELICVDESENYDLNNKICREAKQATAMYVDLRFLDDLAPQTKMNSVTDFTVCNLNDTFNYDFEACYRMFPNALLSLEVFVSASVASQDEEFHVED